MARVGLSDRLVVSHSSGNPKPWLALVLPLGDPKRVASLEPKGHPNGVSSFWSWTPFRGFVGTPKGNATRFLGV